MNYKCDFCGTTQSEIPTDNRGNMYLLNMSCQVSDIRFPIPDIEYYKKFRKLYMCELCLNQILEMSAELFTEDTGVNLNLDGICKVMKLYLDSTDKK